MDTHQIGCTYLCQVACAALATETLQLKEELLTAIETGKDEMRCCLLLLYCSQLS